MEHRDEPNPERDGREVVLEFLRGLDGVPQIDDETARDVEKLTDVLLDHSRGIDGTALLYYLVALLAPHFDRLLVGVCEREHLFLHPKPVSEAAVVEVYCRNLDGDRRKPFSRWCPIVLRDVALRVRKDPDCSLFQVDEKSTPRDRINAELAKIVNRQNFDARRIAWMSFVGETPAPEIARITHLPLEHVECVIAEFFRSAMKAAGYGPPPGSTDDQIGGASFWNTMEGGT